MGQRFVTFISLAAYCAGLCRKIYGATWDFLMARENGESYKTDASVLRETITATVKALGEGRIKPEELPIDPKTNKSQIRYAPGYSSIPPAERIPSSPYTVDALAKFLGETKLSTGVAHEAFRTTFAALELISEGYLNESAIKGMEVWKWS